MKTIIAVPDFTREAHLKKILPPVLKDNAGAEIIIATGLHRSPTKKEIRKNLGAITDKINISVHNHRDALYFGRSKAGVPVWLNKKLKEADRVITVGVVEPHLYAGYSGGVKVVAIGLAGEKTINYTHHPRFLDSSGTKITNLRNNPFQDYIQEIISIIPIKYSINIVNDNKGDILKIFKGAPENSFRNAVKYSKKIFEKKVYGCFDIVICGTPAGKGINMYQASRAFNYIANTKKPAIKKNSLLLVKAGLEEGFGRGLGEKRFMKKLLEMKDPDKLIDKIKKGGCLAGEHRAYMVAKALKKAKLGFISKNARLYKNKVLPFLFFGSLKETGQYIRKNFRNPRICRVKNAFTNILTN
ncbi:MAG: lactate racemase domain-containing protein [Candidatus Omnitrophota bacterium]|jgi:nickel-dependent lactate racemase